MHETNPKKLKTTSNHQVKQAITNEEVINNFGCASSLPFFFRKVITLLDMNEFAAGKMVRVTAHIEYLEKAAWFHSPELGKWSPTESKKAKNSLTEILDDLEFLSLSVTKIQCERVISEIDALNPRTLAARGAALRQVLEDELKGRTFFKLCASQVGIFNNTIICGEQFKLNFKNANGELIEAGNCLALDRYTACVCHLMRSLEYGLTALESELNIVRPEKGSQRTWGKTLERISDEIKKRDGNPPANWKKDKPFYLEIHAMLKAIQLAYRDKTMHVESTYDESGANKVFQLSKVVLEHLAKKLSEKP